MKIPSAATDRKMAFVALDVTDLKTRETGLSGFTVYRMRDGGTATLWTTPTIIEPSAANMPGVYHLLIDEDTTLDAGHDEEEYVVHITHASMAPVTRSIRIYRPKGTEGQTATMASGNVNSAVQSIAANALNAAAIAANAITSSKIATDAIGAAQFAQGAADKVWSSATRTLTAFSTGLALSVWHVLEASIVTASTIGLKVKTNLDAAITTRSSHGDPDPGGLLDAAISTRATPAQVATELATYDGPTNADMVARTLVAANYATAANQTTILNRLGAFTGSGINTILGFFQALLRSDATDPSDVGGTYAAATDSQQAIRDRGDAAWVTGAGGSVPDTINIQPLIPNAIDVANTASYRLGIMLFNSIDDLPSTAEITPGTISIDRKAVGGTAWSAIVTDAACLEIAGLVYYDEVFDAATGYLAGDSIRITFKNQKVTVAANDHELIGSTGRIFYTSIRESMRGTDGAFTDPSGFVDAAVSTRATPAQVAAELATYDGPTKAEMDAGFAALNDPALAAIADAVWDEARAGHVGAGSFGEEVQAHALSSELPSEPPTAAANADAVWDEARADHVGAGSFGEGVLVQTNNDKTGYTLTTADKQAIADELLKRDFNSVSGEAARSMLNALRFLRNRWAVSGTTLTVYAENDTTVAWTATITTDAAADPVTQSDPA